MIELGVTPTLIQPVIICGGSGTRLWPLSREHHPKQLHALNGERTLLQETAGALRSGLEGSVEPLVVCNESAPLHGGRAAARASACKPKAILLEPVGRGTAPALTLAAVPRRHGRRPGAAASCRPTMSSRDDDAFRARCSAAPRCAQPGLHRRPSACRRPRAETGYGYIRAGRATPGRAVHRRASSRSPMRRPRAGIRRVAASTLEQRHVRGARVGVARRDRQLPQGHPRGVRARVPAGQARRRLPARRADAFDGCPSDSIDYAVMERITTSHASPSGRRARWTRAGPTSARGTRCGRSARRTRRQRDRTATCTSPTRRNALVLRAAAAWSACVGLEDLVVVETPDAVLVAHKDKRAGRGQAGRRALKAQGRTETLAAPQGAPPLGQLRQHRARRALPGQAHRGGARRRAVAADAPPPRRALDRGARHRAGDARRRDVPAHRERIDLHPDRHAAPPGEPRQGAARASSRCSPAATSARTTSCASRTPTAGRDPLYQT